MRERRPLLTALAVRECAKPWGEADADVCEAIDFLEYYAREAVQLQSHGAEAPPAPRRAQRADLPPARRHRRHRAVELPDRHPARHGRRRAGHRQHRRPQARRAGARLRLRAHAGAAERPACRPNALALLPGEGDVGQALVEDPRTATIAFTGSGAVGLEIIRRAADTKPGQRQLKRVVAEMGGKNCVIVDADADLDDAVPALVDSAFIYAGQKCSAADRVLVHQAIADQLVERVAGAVETLQVGQADTFGTDVPPVIEQEAQERVKRLIEQCGDKHRREPDRRSPGRRAGSSRPPSPPTSTPARPSSSRRSSARCSPSRR